MIIHALHRLNQMLLLLAHSLWTHLPLLLLVLFCVALLRLLQALPRIYAFVTLPATLLHELLHAALGWLLFAEPYAFSLWPRRQGRHWQLGEVKFHRLRFYNALPVALAPLLAAVALPWVWQARIDPYAHPGDLLIQALLLCTLGLAALPSRQDWRTGLRVGWPLLLTLLGLVALWQLLAGRI